MWKVDQLLQLFAPFECLSCHREGGLLCHSCGFEVLVVAPNQCYSCLRTSPRALCATCQPTTDLQGVRVAASYEGVSAQLVSRLKFARTQAAARLIAQIMDTRLPPSSVDTVVVHIPTAASRIRQRGYDQAQLIAREFARCRRLPYRDLLRRHGNSRQLGANRQQRHEQLRAAFYCPRPERLKGKCILLIDDVLTTGSTVEAAARACKQDGAQRVAASLFAQKIS